MDNILISVVVPVYNVEKYLKRCVDSILTQTYTNLEVILIDDGSTDASSNICNEYVDKDRRVRVRHQQNGGLSAARNTGISIAKGDYIAFVDSDDFIHPQMIECLYKGMSENKVMLSVCGFKEVSSDDTMENEFDENGYRVYTAKELLNMYYDYDEKKTLVIAAWNKLYHRDLLLTYNFPAGKLYEDVYTTPKLLFTAEKICVNNSPLYYYFQRPDSIMHSMDSRKKFDNYMDAFENMSAYVRKIGDEELTSKSEVCILKATYVIERQNAVWSNKEYQRYVKKLYKENYRRYISNVKEPMWRLLYALMRYVPKAYNFVLRKWR